jgi:hypothetical protein
MAAGGSDSAGGSRFFTKLPAFARFADVTDASSYRPLPGERPGASLSAAGLQSSS